MHVCVDAGTHVCRLYMPTCVLEMNLGCMRVCVMYVCLRVCTI